MREWKCMYAMLGAAALCGKQAREKATAAAEPNRACNKCAAYDTRYNTWLLLRVERERETDYKD